MKAGKGKSTIKKNKQFSKGGGRKLKTKKKRQTAPTPRTKAVCIQSWSS